MSLSFRDYQVKVAVLLFKKRICIGVYPAKTVPEMTYNVFSGTLNPTHFTSPTCVYLPV